ncbi:MAG: ABC-2 type transport system permease protein [Halobacteriales archaeon]|jgi:ABC-2 type transport system permease protein
MRRIGTLVVVLFKNWLRSREAVFFSLAFPIILLVIFSLVFAGGSAHFTIFVQNEDVGADGQPTNLSATFVETLAENDVFTVKRIDPDQNLSRWARENRSSGTKRVVVIPDGFAGQVRNGSAEARKAVIIDTIDRVDAEVNDSTRDSIRQGLGRQGSNATNSSVPAEITFLTPSDDETGPAVRGILESHVARFNERALGVDQPPATITTGTMNSRDLGAVDYYLPAFIATIVLINGVISVTSEVASFKSDGTLKRLVATPLRKRDWILANVIQQSVLALVLAGVMVLVAHLAFGVTVIPGPLSVALVLLGAVAFSALGITLGSFVDDPDAATSLGNAIAFPMMFLSGVFWEISLMPEYLQTVAELMPLYHFHRGLRRLMILGTSDGVVFPFAILGVGAAAFLALAVRVSEWQDLDG